MNMTDLPTTWAQWLDFVLAIFAGAAQRVLTNPWSLALALVLLVALTAAYTAPMGTDDDAPILTEADREAAR